MRTSALGLWLSAWLMLVACGGSTTADPTASTTAGTTGGAGGEAGGTGGDAGGAGGTGGDAGGAGGIGGASGDGGEAGAGGSEEEPVCPAASTDSLCAACAKLACCEHVQPCFADEHCGCSAACVFQGNDPVACTTGCGELSDATLAITTCILTQCSGVCGTDGM